MQYINEKAMYMLDLTWAIYLKPKLPEATNFAVTSYK